MASTAGIVLKEAPESAGSILGEGRAAELAAFELALVDFFVEAADLLGVPKSVAAIYGVCFASAGPLTFADIEARLDLSKGSVSQGLRLLREMGALKPAGKSDDRRETFEPDMALRKLAAHWLEMRLQKQLDAGRTRLQLIAKSVPAGPAASTKELRQRLKTLQTWHDKGLALLPLAKAFLKLT